MIFVTVGTQLAFDRLIGAVDDWAGRNAGVEVFAQTGPSTAVPKHLPHAQFVSPSRAEELMRSADLIVSHAGMGSLLTALRYQRPILILPRQAKLGEHRNEHQLATARWMVGRSGVTVAWTEQEIADYLDRRHQFAAGSQIPEHASGPLVDRLRTFIGAGG